MTNYPKISIIILNWNGWQDTIECLESLYRITYPNYEVIVVDNGSKDESIQKIKRWADGKIVVNSNFFKYNPNNKPLRYFEYTKKELENGSYLEEKKKLDNLLSNKKLFILKNDKNYGFAEGNNVAIRQILKENKSKYVLLLNNDTVVDPNFLTELARVAEGDKEIGIVGPKIYYYNNSKKIWFAGGKISKLGKINFPNSNTIDNRKITITKKIDFLTGCALLIKREVLTKIGLLDPSYFLYTEDVDFCYKTKKANYKIVFIPKSFIWHKINKSSQNNSFGYLYYTTRNYLIFRKRNNLGILWGLIFILLRMIKRVFISFLSLDIKQINIIIKATFRGIKDLFTKKTGKVNF